MPPDPRLASLAHREQAMAAVLLCRQPGVGAATFRRLVARRGSPLDALLDCPARGDRPKSTTLDGIERARQLLAAGSCPVLYLGGPAYPEPLAELSEPPPLLFVRGNPAALSLPLVAVVGAREASEEAIGLSSRVAAACVRAGFGVVSGGARGVDAAAHRAALGAGGRTVVVLGTGIDVVYPPEHGALFEQACVEGAVVTELLPGAPPARGFFLTRNRIIAGLSRAVLVVRATSRSGSVVTARAALSLGRRAASLAAEAGDPLGQASLLLEARGAPRLREGRELIDFLRGLA